ncbi:hypothetical protein IW150_003324 [Coemansia sp. RSA 2607]|nr:hypothetical protein IW150_003324 [Coemansia sp. RSA 2607]KAJ2386604.1 hypothetical protein GGI05_004336 [Coemansia sp. RSA 2603]
MSHSVGILTVSDKCAQGQAQDTSGPALRTLLESRNNKWQVTHMHIVGDEQHEIAATVQQWSTHCRLVVVTGGTGLAAGDVTVAALDPLFTKRLPSMATAMVVGSLRITPMAALSQVACGLVGTCVVVAVPGSRKGSVENLEQIIDVLPHAVETAGAGRSTRELHAGAALCGCGRVEGKPAAPGDGTVAGRARQSPHRMVPVDEALKRALDSVVALPPVDVALADIRAGMVLAEPVTALEPVPSYAASVMDGYAVLAADGPGEYRVLGASTAGGDGQKVQVTSGTIVRIATGAPLPPGADAVVMVEDTQLVERDAAGEEVRVRVLAKADKGQYIRPVGHDVAAGCELLAAGTVVTSAGGEVGAMALSGHTHFRMHGVPRVGVLSTGDELVSDGSQLAPGRVRDSNRPALVCALRALGCVVEDLGVAPDDAEQLAGVLDKALHTCHGVVTSGGVSMGERDALRPAVARLGGSEVFGRVLMKPAKPTMFAAMPQGRFVCGLPGNPASAVVALHMFAVPVLRKMLGHPGGIDSLRPSVQAVLRVRDPLVLDRLRPEYVRARLAWDKSRAEWVASVGDTRQQSSRMASMVAANALVALPLGTDERPEVRDGERLTAIVIAPVFFE